MSDDCDEAQVVWRHKRRHEFPVHPLDPIDPKLVGGARIQWLREQAIMRSWQEDWINITMNTMLPDSIEDWCGWNGTGVGEIVRTRDCYHSHLLDLQRSIFRRANDPTIERIFAAYFEVLKSCGLLARGILNCKPLNARTRNPPGLVLPHIHDIFALIAFIGAKGYYCIADFRHYFWQLPLPHIARRLFSVQCGGLLLELVAWAMGFSWTPFIAQSISMLVARIAITEAGYTARPPCESGSLPPFWWVEDKSGQSIGAVIFWYDNLLIACRSETAGQAITKRIAKVASSGCANLNWKKAKAGDVFTVTRGELEYLGIAFTFDHGQLRWTHAAANINRWRPRLDTKPVTWRDYSAMLGVIIWDWTVSGAPRSSIEAAITVAQTIGSAAADDEDTFWDTVATITDKQSLDVTSLLEQVLARPWSTHIGRHTDCTEEHTLLLAVDAMNTQGAAVILGYDGAEQDFRIFPMQRLMHINAKETRTALEGLEWSLERISTNTMVRIATDNTAAFVVLRRQTCTFDVDLQRRVDAIRTLFRDKNCDWLPVQVPGIDQAADARSRGSVTEVPIGKRTVAWLTAATADERRSITYRRKSARSAEDSDPGPSGGPRTVPGSPGTPGAPAQRPACVTSTGGLSPDQGVKQSLV